ncbi:long-chain fatty acid--CoA ligase [Actinospica durhamensis]|uniref:Long-chain fatty acid--CoA ligase n=1 Tax=Actinospica durhamensis TaxID=1508375 RepID=A0A941ILS1_9ACTN|nr:long-chain fatty acid--CoA ligase [Actinospica durhamensis]MBR7833325.1 long-chain fatty acid--CoA ligase [Actinospica durhamensis]
MRNQGLGSWTARRARKSPQATAVIHREQRHGYRELHARTLGRAAQLHAAGLRRGDRVAYLGPNHPAYLETLFAAGMLGAVLVPLNTRLATAELAYCLTDSGSAVLVYTEGYADAARAAAAEVEHAMHLIPAAASVIDEAEFDEPVGLDDPCMILYTSGTTGRPKGVVLSHGNLIWNAINVVVDTDLAHDEVTLVSAPLFHTAALGMTCLPTLLKGGTVVLEETFDEQRALELIARHGVTLLFGVPAMYQRLADAPGFADADLGSIRTLMCGGAPVPRTLIDRYLARGLGFVQGYGLTEASPGTLLLDAQHAVSKAGSAGVPHFFTDVRLVGAGADTDAAASGDAEADAGELRVRGPNVMLGYWGRPQETAQALGDDGWLRTGDLAVADADGYVRIVDRLKDLIISGGENIAPAEVEEVFYRHPAVAECAVIGVPDERWGEVGRAVVVARSTQGLGGAAEAEELAAELIGFAAQQLAKYKVPKSVVFATALPRSGAGKVLKSVLREQHGKP